MWRRQLLCVGIGVVWLHVSGGRHAWAADRLMFRPAGTLDKLPPNRLKDGGFEHVGTDRSDWEAYGKGFAIDREVRCEGRQSIRCHAADEKAGFGARRTFELNHTRLVPVRISVQSKCKDVPGSPTPGYSIYVDLIHTDGTPTWGQIKPLPTGTRNWARHTLTILPGKPIKLMHVHLLFRGVRGTVWFDDATVFVFDDANVRLFDGEAVELAESAGSATSSTNVGAIAKTAAGLELRGEVSTGRICDVRVGENRSVSGKLVGGVFVQDAGERGPIYRAPGPITIEGPVATQRGVIDAMGLDVTTKWTSASDHITGRIELQSRQPIERALSVAVALPVRAVGGWWHDDIRRRQQIEPGRTYCNATHIGVGKTGTWSRYPIAAVTTDDWGLALAVPLDEPRIVRLTYDAEHEWLYAAFDLAVSPVPQKLPNRADVEFELFTFDPSWGFRAAWQTYCDFHPAWFERRCKDVGLWMAFAKISQVERAEDFGFVFKEGLGDEAYDNAHGILTFRYTEPQSHWQRMPEGMDRTYEAAMALINRLSREGKPAERRMCQAVLSSCAINAEGRYWLWLLKAPWCDGANLALNPDPDLPGEVTKAKVNYDPAEAAKLYADDPAHGVDGEYLDSLDGWSDIRNFSREHFKHVDSPLVYETESRRACILNAFSIWEFVHWLTPQVHRAGKLMMANATPMRYGWQAPHLDIMGQEHDWNPSGRWQPMSDEELCFRRTLCGTKPYLLLQNSDFNVWTEQHTRWYFMRAGAYGVQPSFFSANAATDHYFGNPTWYNRDRPLFKKLIPVIRRIGRAGWRPVTYARVEPAPLQVERFGQLDGAELFLTVHNPGDKPVCGRLTLELRMPAKRAIDLVAGQALPMESGAEPRAIAVTVPARETLFLHLTDG